MSNPRYLTVSVDTVLLAMAEHGLIPVVEGLSPLEAADLAHAEAQFIGKRLVLRALADGRNVIFEISQASPPSVQSWRAAPRRFGYDGVTWVFTKIDAEGSVRHSAAAYRRGLERTAPAAATAGATSRLRRSAPWPAQHLPDRSRPAATRATASKRQEPTAR